MKRGIHTRVFQKTLIFEFDHGVEFEHTYGQYEHNKKKIGNFNAFPAECRAILWFFNLVPTPLKAKKKLFRLWGLWYSNRPAWTHSFNAKIGFEKYAPSPKILPKNCLKSAFQTKPAKLDTFWPISQASLHIYQNRFLRWNREFEPVDLNTINPIIRTIFFSLIKGSEANLN